MDLPPWAMLVMRGLCRGSPSRARPTRARSGSTRFVYLFHLQTVHSQQRDGLQSGAAAIDMVDDRLARAGVQDFPQVIGRMGGGPRLRTMGKKSANLIRHVNEFVRRHSQPLRL